MTTSPNKMSDEELERAFMDLFCKTEQFALEFFGGKTSKEEFASNNAAGRTLDHQEAAHIAMQLIKQHREAYALEELEKAFGSGERGGMDNWGRSVNIYLRTRIAELREKAGRDDPK